MRFVYFSKLLEETEINNTTRVHLMCISIRRARVTTSYTD
jgi:hypothetical protein